MQSFPEYPGGSDLAVGRAVSGPRPRPIGFRAAAWGCAGLLAGLALAWLAVQAGLSAEYVRPPSAGADFERVEVRLLGVPVGERPVLPPPAAPGVVSARDLGYPGLSPDGARQAEGQAVRAWRPRLWLLLLPAGAAAGGLSGLVGLLLREAGRRRPFAEPGAAADPRRPSGSAG